MTLAHHTAYEGSSTLLPELRMVGHARFRAADALPPHAHSDAFEICYLVSGSVDWWAERELFEVRGGELYVTRPNVVHGGQHAVMNPCELYWFQLAPPRNRPLPGLSRRESKDLLDRLNGLRPHSFAASSDTAMACRRLHDLHGRAKRDIMSTIAARAALHTLLSTVISDAVASRVVTRLSPEIATAMRAIVARDSSSVRIEDVAREVGLAAGTLHARFVQETGLTPGAWRLRHVVARAKVMLSKCPQRPVTQIAMDLGFSSSQYFATAFRRVTGLTPTAYAMAMTKGQSAR